MRIANGIYVKRPPMVDTHTTVKTLTEKELAEALQAYFRRFVAAARVTLDAETGEPVVRVEFKGPSRETRQ